MSLELLHEVPNKRRITCAVFQRDSNFLAVALAEGTIAVLDVSTQKTVRLFHGHTCEITNMVCIDAE
jgi:WD40 repeat protein